MDTVWYLLLGFEMTKEEFKKECYRILCVESNPDIASLKIVNLYDKIIIDDVGNMLEPCIDCDITPNVVFNSKEDRKTILCPECQFRIESRGIDGIKLEARWNRMMRKQ